MCSLNPKDWIKMSEMLLGPTPASFEFEPKVCLEKLWMVLGPTVPASSSEDTKHCHRHFESVLIPAALIALCTTCSPSAVASFSGEGPVHR